MGTSRALGDRRPRAVIPSANRDVNRCVACCCPTVRTERFWSDARSICWGRAPGVRRRAIGAHRAPASIESSSRAPAIAPHATRHSDVEHDPRPTRCWLRLQGAVSVAARSRRHRRHGSSAPHCCARLSDVNRAHLAAARTSCVRKRVATPDVAHLIRFRAACARAGGWLTSRSSPRVRSRAARCGRQRSGSQSHRPATPPRAPRCGRASRQILGDAGARFAST